jgi:hypothetical protein
MPTMSKKMSNLDPTYPKPPIPPAPPQADSDGDDRFWALIEAACIADRYDVNGGVAREIATAIRDRAEAVMAGGVPWPSRY